MNKRETTPSVPNQTARRAAPVRAPAPGALHLRVKTAVRAGSKTAIGCPGGACNSNHNQTVVQVPSRPRAEPKALRVRTAVRAGSKAGNKAGGTCPSWGCPDNHNQTVVQAPSPPPRAAPKALRVKTAVRAGTKTAIGCPSGICNSNHNQSIVRAAPRSARRR